MILDEVLALAALILPLAGLPVYGAMVAVLLPKLDELIDRLVADLSQTTEWSPAQAAGYAARIAALRADPAWKVEA